MLLSRLQIYKDSKNYDEDSIISILADVIDHCCDEHIADKALMKVHESVYGHHFNEEFADKAVNEFFYIDDKTGTKIHGPFISKEKAKDYYTKSSRELSTDNNFNDFYVALNKVISDHKKLLENWFGDDEIMDRLVDLTLSCINDDDYSCKGCKVWNHISAEYL